MPHDAGAAMAVSLTVGWKTYRMDVTRAHVITGSFGSGKTTAIRRLMAQKPEGELWVVILNEFTDAGIDALQVAQSARGKYDVRLVAGGCLCCRCATAIQTGSRASSRAAGI